MLILHKQFMPKDSSTGRREGRKVGLSPYDKQTVEKARAAIRELLRDYKHELETKLSAFAKVHPCEPAEKMKKALNSIAYNPDSAPIADNIVYEQLLVPKLNEPSGELMKLAKGRGWKEGAAGELRSLSSVMVTLATLRLCVEKERFVDAYKIFEEMYDRKIGDPDGKAAVAPQSAHDKKADDPKKKSLWADSRLLGNSKFGFTLGSALALLASAQEQAEQPAA